MRFFTSDFPLLFHAITGLEYKVHFVDVFEEFDSNQEIWKIQVFRRIQEKKEILLKLKKTRTKDSHVRVPLRIRIS
jgi:hypothetical protein